MSDEARLDAVFADANDFEVCNALASVVEDLYGFEVLRKRSRAIPRDRWLIHSVWGNTGFFECEGYSRFWSTNTDHIAFAEGMLEIGFPLLASILEVAIALIPREILGNFDAVEAHSPSETAREKRGELMDAKFITEKPDIRGQLATYIRSRRGNFLDLVDDIEKAVIHSRKLHQRPSE